MDDSSVTGNDYWDEVVAKAASKRPLAFATWLAIDAVVNKLISFQDRLSAGLRDAAGAP